MARLQDLHPDQQAVLRLLLGRRMRYAELAEILGLPADRVRERALDAVDGLAPDDVDGLDLADRDRIADYLLGQQDDHERAKTEALIADSAPAREWLSRVTPELTTLSADALPIPDPGPVPEQPTDPGAPSAGITAAFAALDAPEPTSSPLSERLRAALSTLTGRLVAGGTALVVLVLVVLLATGALGGGNDDGGRETAATPTTTTETSEAALASAVASALPQQINFSPPPNATGPAAQAIAVGQTNINDNVPGLVFTADKLPKLPGDRVYSIWVVGGGQPDALLGRLDKVAESGEALVDRNGKVAPVFVPFATLDGSATRVIDVRPYTKIRVTRDSPKSTRPGTTVLSGSLKSASSE